jgi:hypothetical protein
VLGRLVSGKLKPSKAFELSYALLTLLTGRLRGFTADLTKDVWKLEQRVSPVGTSAIPNRSSTRCFGRDTVCSRSAPCPP